MKSWGGRLRALAWVTIVHLELEKVRALTLSTYRFFRLGQRKGEKERERCEWRGEECRKEAFLIEPSVCLKLQLGECLQNDFLTWECQAFAYALWRAKSEDLSYLSDFFVITLPKSAVGVTVGLLPGVQQESINRFKMQCLGTGLWSYFMNLLMVMPVQGIRYHDRVICAI